MSFTQQDNPSVAFDRNNHLYVLQDQHTGDNTVGALVLDTFDFSGSSPTALLSPGQQSNNSAQATATVLPQA